MGDANNRGVMLKIGFILLCAGLLIPAAAAWAQDGAFKLPDFYPENFSGYGCIDSINGDGVVIDDRLMRFSLAATYHTPNRPTASWLLFEPGYMVGYIWNDDEKIESLWYIQPCK
jgi:hypothetical protein